MQDRLAPPAPDRWTDYGPTDRRKSAVRRTLLLALFIGAWIGAQPLAAQESELLAEGPWWMRIVYFILAIPYTLYLIFVDGERMHLLPAPLIATWYAVKSFREWRRQKFWSPRLIHIMAGLALATIILINIDWAMNGGEMVTQRYVVIALFGLFPYVVYLIFQGPRVLGQRHAPVPPVVDDAEWATASAPPRKRSMVPLYVGVGAVALVGLGLVGATVVSNAARLASYRRPELAPLRAPQSVVPTARGVEMGDPEAPLTIIEFGDFQCPACGTFALRHKPEVERALVETGQARFVFFDLPITSMHANAFLAARAARCAEDQDAFWTYHDEIFRNQEAWSELSAPHEAFAGYAATVGLDVDDFSECLESDRHADVVRANDELGTRLGIKSTPYIVVIAESGDPRRARTYTFTTIEAAVEEARAASARNPRRAQS